VKGEDICAIIPALNAETSLGEVIDRTFSYLRRIIVINDGSNDRTGELARRHGAELISLPANRGKGFALRRGFAQARQSGCRAVVTLDADGQHDPADIPNFLRAHEEDAESILIGSRMGQVEEFPRQRYYSNRAAAYFISKALGQYLEDTQCGFRLYPVKVIQEIGLKTSRFQTETEILLRAVRQGIPLKSIPVKNIYLNGNAPPSHFRPVVDTFYICLVVLQGYLGIV